MSHPYRFYAVVVPGLENIAAAELESLSVHEIATEEGGVVFSGTMETMFRANLRSRTVTRILLRLKRFTATSFPELQHGIEQIDWSPYLDAQSSLSVHATCRHSRLMHSGKVENAVIAALKRNGYGTWPDEKTPQQIHVRIDNNRCRLSIDSSGERLDRRGYRLESGKAPVRESLASAVLQWMEWRPQETLVVPMCGSGTFAIEAALMALKTAPGLTHAFPFLHWPGLKMKAWQRLLAKTEAMAAPASKPLAIFSSDINAEAVAIAQRNAQRAGVEKAVAFEQKDVRMIGCPDETDGLLVMNPPYGRRIDTNVESLYAALGGLLRDECRGFRAAIFSPDRACERALALPVQRRLRVRHGGNWIDILHV